MKLIYLHSNKVSQYYKTLFQWEYKGIRLFVNFILKLKCSTFSTLRTPRFPPNLYCSFYCNHGCFIMYCFVPHPQSLFEDVQGKLILGPIWQPHTHFDSEISFTLIQHTFTALSLRKPDTFSFEGCDGSVNVSLEWVRSMCNDKRKMNNWTVDVKWL